jgi:hypothetical protein
VVNKKWLVSVVLAAVVLFSSLVAIGFYTKPYQTAPGNQSTPCVPLSISVPDVSQPGHYLTIIPTTISYHVQIWNSTGSLVADSYICNKTIVNAGLDILASLIGQNKTGALNYMEVSTDSTTPAATDTSCPSAQTTNGFTLQNIQSTYSHTTGSSTFTEYGKWTYTGISLITIYKACLLQHSGAWDGTGASGAGNVMVDESLINGATGYALQQNYVFQLTVTVTV